MSETERWLIAELKEQLRQALDAMTGVSSAVEPAAAPEEPDANSLWWEQPLSASPDAIIWVGAPEQSWREIGLRTLQAAGIEECEPSEMRSTWMEILSQALSALARAVGTRLRQEITCSQGREAGPPGPAYARLSITLTPAGTLPIDLSFSPGLCALLAPQEVAPVPEAADLQPARSSSGQMPKAVEGSKTLDLLLEVELPVSVSFGRAQLRLKDVIKLTSGSIVELNRSVTEPVEVIVNNCVIARGEVVVIDGYYGVRIHQIISRQDRLRTLA